MSLHWSLATWLWPLLLILAVGAAVFAVVVYRRTDPPPGAGVRRLLTWLRAGALFCLVLAVGGPFLAVVRTRVEPPELVVLVEDSASMAITDAGRDPSGSERSRWQRSLDICGLLAEFARDRQPPVRPVFLRGNGFSGPEEFRPGDGALDGPSRLGTDLDAFVRKARTLRRGRPIGAVVLISDGDQTDAQRGGSGSHDARRGPGLPAGRFFTVGVGDPQGPVDRLITDVRYPKVVHRGDEVQIDCVVEQRFHTAAPGDSLTLTLAGPEGILARVDLPDSGGTMPASLSFLADQEGSQIYELGVTPLVNERFPANNEVSLGITVRKERARLLLLAAAPRWDGRFLAQAALKESRLVLEVAYSTPQGLVLADSLTAWRLPGTAAGWSDYDGLILEYASWPDSLTTEQGAALLEAVRRGMGVLMLPGPGYRGQGSPCTILPRPWRRLLPVTLRARAWLTGDFFLTPLAGSRGHPVLAGVTQAAGLRNQSAEGGLAGMPPQQAVIPVEADSAATVLLSCRSRQGESWPVLVLRKSGQGRVAWFGGDALWRTAFREAAVGLEPGGREQPGRRLLRNLLVWLGTGEETGGLRLQGDLPLAVAGQPLALRGVWQDMRGQPVGSGRVALALSPVAPGGQAAADTAGVRTFTAGAPDPDTGEFQFRIPPLAAGRYRLQMVGQGAAKAESRPLTLVVDSRSPEDRQVRLDRRALVQMAAAAGGRYVSGADSSQVASLLADLDGLDWRGTRQQVRSRYDPAAGLPFLAVVVLLLGVEWYLRRRHGLL